MSQQWMDELSDEFDWPPNQLGPEKVAEEAEEYGFESVSELINKMKDAPSNCSTGFEKWKWYRNMGKSFGLTKK